MTFFMKPLRLALFIILLLFHLAMVIVSFNFSLSLINRLVQNPLVFQVLAIFGLTVLLVTFGLMWFDRRSARKKIERLEAEKNQIKAEVFDMRKREQEIEQEIASFKSSLPAEESRSGGAVIVEDNSNEPDPISHHPTKPDTEEPPAEYGTLKPRSP